MSATLKVFWSSAGLGGVCETNVEEVIGAEVGEVVVPEPKGADVDVVTNGLFGGVCNAIVRVMLDPAGHHRVGCLAPAGQKRQVRKATAMARRLTRRHS